MQFDNSFGYSEPQPCTALGLSNRIVRLLKLLKQLGLVGFGKILRAVGWQNVMRTALCRLRALSDAGYSTGNGPSTNFCVW